MDLKRDGEPWKGFVQRIQMTVLAAQGRPGGREARVSNFNDS